MVAIVSFPDYLSRGKGSGELWPNPQFSFYGAHQLGHAKLEFDWSVWLHRGLVVKQSWDLIALVSMVEHAIWLIQQV